MKSLYNTYIDVISYSRLDKTRLVGEEELNIFDNETVEKLKRLADGNIYKKLVHSLAPSIWENDDVKKGILC